MKVYNLACPLNHRFEGWFRSEEDFNTQQSQSILCCPMCDSVEITRMPSAPYISSNVGKQEGSSVVVENAASDIPTPNDAMHLSPEQKEIFQEKMQAMMLTVVREIMEKTEDVGTSFAEEARRIHYKESPERSIRGITTPDETAELLDEGIEVYSLPLTPSLKTTLQ